MVQHFHAGPCGRYVVPLHTRPDLIPRRSDERLRGCGLWFGHLSPLHTPRASNRDAETDRRRRADTRKERDLHLAALP